MRASKGYRRVASPSRLGLGTRTSKGERITRRFSSASMTRLAPPDPVSRSSSHRMPGSISSVGVELVQVLDVAQGPAHPLADTNAIKRGLERFGGGVHGVHSRTTGILGCSSCLLTSDSCSLTGDSRHLSGLPQKLTLHSNQFERFPVLVTNGPRFFCQPPHLFRLIPPT